MKSSSTTSIGRAAGTQGNPEGTCSASVAAEARNVRAKVRYRSDVQMASSESMTHDGETLVFVFGDALRDYQTEYGQRHRSAYAPGASIIATNRLQIAPGAGTGGMGDAAGFPKAA